MEPKTPINPYRPPEADESAYVAYEPGTHELADRGTRLLAAMIDGFISMLIIFPAQYAFGVFDGFPESAKEQPFENTLIWAVAGFALWCALHGYLIARGGQTIGKRVMSIRVVTLHDDRPVSVGRYAFLRMLPSSVVVLIPFVGSVLSLINVLFIFRADRRCIHDMIAGTRVVRA